MGLLRTLLAISVVLTHMNGGLSLVGGVYAVQLFYVVSGYFMSLILVELKSYSTVRGFYTNRLLRLLPVYYVVAMASLATYAITGNPQFWETYDALAEHDGLTASLIGSNLLVFGQAQLLFTTLSEGVVSYPQSYLAADPQLWQGLLVPQAWTLELELMFYLIAPFVLVRFRLLIILLIASLGVRAYLATLGLAETDPWTYRFFPAELALFLVGALCHQLAGRLDIGAKVPPWGPIAAVVLVTMLLFGYRQLESAAGGGATILLFALVIVSLPLLLQFQNKYNWDGKIGELSYPIYISHWLTLHVVRTYWGESAFDSVASQLVVLALVVCLAQVLNRFVADPLERSRDKIRS